jgi:hypothetical protein
MGWCISPNGDPSTRMPFPLPSWRQHAIGPTPVWKGLRKRSSMKQRLARPFPRRPNESATMRPPGAPPAGRDWYHLRLRLRTDQPPVVGSGRE